MLNVMTWNVKHTTPAADVIAEVTRLVREHRVDVVCLQEVRRGRLPRRLAKALGMHRAAAWHPLPSGEGVAIFSKYPIVSRQRQRLNWHRRYLEVSICLSDPADKGRPLDLLNIGCVHISAWAPARRQLEVAQVLGLVPDRRIVLAGDFNLEPEQVRRYIGYRLAWLGVEAPTYKDRTIDYVLATPDVTVVDYMVLPANISDHRPLLVRVG